MDKMEMTFRRKNLIEIEYLTRNNPNEAFDIGGCSFVVTARENYDELKHKANAYDELMQDMKNGSTNAQLTQCSNLLMADPKLAIDVPGLHIFVVNKAFLNIVLSEMSEAAFLLKNLYGPGTIMSQAEECSKILEKFSDIKVETLD